MEIQNKICEMLDQANNVVQELKDALFCEASLDSNGDRVLRTTNSDTLDNGDEFSVKGIKKNDFNNLSENHLLEVFKSLSSHSHEGIPHISLENVDKALNMIGCSSSDTDMSGLTSENIRFDEFKVFAGEALRKQLITKILMDSDLHSTLAQHLPKSIDEMKRLSKGKIAAILKTDEFVISAAAKIANSIERHISGSNSNVGRCANAKYSQEGAFQATHGDDKVFQGGLEGAVGLPDPQIMKGILIEHLYGPDSREGFLTTNYKLWTTAEMEIAFLVGDEDDFRYLHESAESRLKKLDSLKAQGPSKDQLNDLKDMFKQLQSVNKKIAGPNTSKYYPGEIGDSFREIIVSFEIDHPEMQGSLLAPDLLSFHKDLQCTMEQWMPDEISKNEFRKSEFQARLAHSEFKVNDHDRRLSTLAMPMPKSLFTQANQRKLELVATSLIPQKDKGSIAWKIVISGVLENIWKFEGEPAEEYEMQGRRRLHLRQLMSVAQVNEAKLRIEEAVSVSAYTGPLFQKYNSVLRNVLKDAQGRVQGFKDGGNKYTTTLHCLTSAVVKLANYTMLPNKRLLWRGLGGMALSETLFFRPDHRNTRGGVELAFMSTTRNREIAMYYSGQSKHHGTVLEIDFDKVNCPAQIDALSMYPGEGEMLFPPLTSLEHIGNPRLETYRGESILVLSIRANKNPNAQTIDRIIAKRRDLVAAMIESLRKELAFELEHLPEPFAVSPQKLREQLEHANKMLAPISEGEVEWFNDDENFRSSWNKALDVKIEVVFSCTSSKILSDLPQAEFEEVTRAWKSKFCERDLIKSMITEASRRGLFEEELNERDKRLETPLSNYSKVGDLICVRILLCAGADANTRNRMGQSALVHAANGRHWQVVGALLHCKAQDVDQRLMNEETVLTMASNSGQWAVVAALLEAKANPNAPVYDKAFKSALECAVSTGAVEIVKMVIASGADANRWFSRGRTPLQHALLNMNGNVENSNGLQVLRLLVDAQGDITGKASDESNALHVAAQVGSIGAAQFLIDSRVDVNAVSKDKLTPLHHAAANNSNLVKILMAARAEVNVQNIKGYSPLHIAYCHGNLDAVQLLIDGRADTEPVGSDSSTILHFACAGSRKDAVAALIAKYQSVNIANEAKVTPLHFAAASCNSEVVSLLIEAQADVDAKCSDSQTPFDYAVADHQAETFRSVLMENKCEREKLEVVKVLIAAKAHIDTTAMTKVAKSGYFEILTLVLEGNLGHVEEQREVQRSLGHCMECAVQADNVKTVNSLLKAKCSVGLKVIGLAAFKGNIELLKVLLASDIQSDLSYDDLPPLHCACFGGHTEAISLILNSKDIKADINQVSYRFSRFENHAVGDMNPIQIAASMGKAEVVSHLIEAKADLNAKSGKSLLHLAASSGSLECIHSLLESKCDVGSTGKNSTEDDAELRLFHDGVISGNLKIVDLLVERKAAVVNVENCTSALPLAVRNNDTEMVLFLIDNKADLNAKSDSDEVTVLHMAAGAGITVMVNTLIYAGAQIDPRTKFVKKDRYEHDDGMCWEWVEYYGSNTPLHYATGHSKEELKCGCVAALLRAQADVNARTANETPKTPLDYAKESGCSQCIQLLEEASKKSL